MTAPDRLVVVAGTGTEVGKTWVACALARELRRRGMTVVARKPAQSFDPADPTTDADELGAATGEDPMTVCPPHRRYEVPMAPPMAASVLGRSPITMAELLDESRSSWPESRPDVGMVELAGGVRSPLAEDGDGVDMVRALDPTVVLVVADAGLGTVNAVRTTLGALGPADDDDGPAVVVHLNRYDDTDDLHRRNRRWLVEHDGTDVTTDVGDLADRITRPGPVSPAGS